MKKTIHSTLAMMAISLSGCNTTPAKAAQYRGRIIEFKSDAAGFDTRTFFYEGKNEVIAFDAQFTPELARQSITHLRKFTDKPISWLIITHPNPDKFNGASVFKSEGAKIFSSQKTATAIPEVQSYKEYYFVEMAKMFKKGDYPVPPVIDQVFENQTDLVLRGGERIQLKELSYPGVSSNQTVVYIPSINSLIVGDLVHYKAHAWLEGGIVNGKPTPTIQGWISDLKELMELFPENPTVYGGRGLTGDLMTVTPEQMRYLKEAQTLVRNEIKILGSKASEFNSPQSNLRYKILAEKFHSLFPDYELTYMIEYGVYGLVQSELTSLK